MATDTVDTSSELLRSADDLISSANSDPCWSWPRMAAFLIRMALEQALNGFWEHACPQLRACSMRAQLLCVREYTEPDVAQRLTVAWDALSSACHYHTYELAPTAAEVRLWHGEVEALARRLAETQQ